jgi:hypothetical protein
MQQKISNKHDWTLQPNDAPRPLAAAAVAGRDFIWALQRLRIAATPCAVWCARFLPPPLLGSSSASPPPPPPLQVVGTARPAMCGTATCWLQVSASCVSGVQPTQAKETHVSDTAASGYVALISAADGRFVCASGAAPYLSPRCDAECQFAIQSPSLGGEDVAAGDAGEDGVFSI